MSKIVPSRVVELIDKALPQVGAQQATPESPMKIHADSAGFLRALLSLLQQIPDHLLPASSSRYLEYVAGIGQIEQQLERWRTHTDALRTSQGFDVNAVTLIRRALSECEDETPVAAVANHFIFLGDPLFAQSVAMDVGNAKSAWERSEYKVTIVMAGSAIEALLLWKIQTTLDAAEMATLLKREDGRFTAKANADNVLEWGLFDLIEAGRLSGVIDKNTATLATYAKDFRNLIHPGRAVRTGIECKRWNAATAIAALEAVIESVK